MEGMTGAVMRGKVDGISPAAQEVVRGSPLARITMKGEEAEDVRTGAATGGAGASGNDDS